MDKNEQKRKYAESLLRRAREARAAGNPARADHLEAAAQAIYAELDKESEKCKP